MSGKFLPRLAVKFRMDGNRAIELIGDELEDGEKEYIHIEEHDHLLADETARCIAIAAKQLEETEAKLQAAEDREKMLREALEYYANIQAWSPLRMVNGQLTKVQQPFEFTVYADMGKKAREALAGEEATK